MDLPEPQADARRSPMRSASWSSSWPGRTRGGGTGASKANSSAWAIASAQGIICRILAGQGRRDGLGYDIRSYDTQGRVRHIEVKATALCQGGIRSAD